jgi:hypothetical protein
MGAEISANLMVKVKNKVKVGEDECLEQMHLAAGLVGGHDYDPDDGHEPWAIQAYQHAKHGVACTDAEKLPALVMVYLESDTPGRPGHICWAYAVGGKVISTDQPSSGRFGLTTVEHLCATWGMHLVGYAYDLNEYMVGHLPTATKPPVKETKPVPKPVATPNIDHAIAATDKALASHRSGAVHDHLAVALAALKSAKKASA